MAQCDVTQLLADSKCYLCLDSKQLDIAIAQTLCEIIAGSDNPPPLACANLFTDGFSGSDGHFLASPPWTNYGQSLIYDSGRAVSQPEALINSGNYITTFTFLNGYVEVEAYGGGYHSVLIRLNPFGVADWYEAGIDMPTGTVYLYRGITELDSAVVVAVPGAVLRLEADGNQFVVKYNGATVLTVTDSDPGAILTAGYVGLFGTLFDGTLSYDNFECCPTD